MLGTNCPGTCTQRRSNGEGHVCRARSGLPPIPLPSWQKLVGKAMETGELILNPSNLDYSENANNVFEQIINIVTDTTPDLIKCLAELWETATWCDQSTTESITAYLEGLILPWQSYLNLTNADHTSAEFHNLAMTIVSSTSLSQDTLPSVIGSLAFATKCTSQKITMRAFLDIVRANKENRTLEEFHSFQENIV